MAGRRCARGDWRSGGCGCVGDRGRGLPPPPGRSTMSRFAWGTFTFGPGVVVAGYVTRRLEGARRLIVVLGTGSAILPAFLDVLGGPTSFRRSPTWLGPVPARAWRSGGDPGAASARQWGNGRPTVSFARSRLRWVSSSSRIGSTPAAVASCSTATTIPPTWRAPRCGSVRGLAHDSTDGLVLLRSSLERRVLPPTGQRHDSSLRRCASAGNLLSAGVAHVSYSGPPCLYVLVRELASRAVALLSVTFGTLGSDFSYLAAWFLPHAAVDWDYLLWPTNFLSPTMQVLHFSTWTPSLPVFFTAIFAIVRGLQSRESGWLALSAVQLAMLFEFKPFAYIVLLAGLCGAAIFAGRDRPARLRYVATVALSVLCTVPFLLSDPVARPGRSAGPGWSWICSCCQGACSSRLMARLTPSPGRPPTRRPGRRCGRPCSCFLQPSCSWR